MPWKDTATGYGWMSIALHWITAVWITLLLFYGNSIGALLGADRSDAIVRHTSIAITGYVLLWLRVGWRFYFGHPAATQKQRGAAFTLGKWIHLTMLVAVGLMLISGPLMVWSRGEDIVVFDWFVLSTPMATSFALSDFCSRVHTGSALVIFLGILLHLGGVYKHLAFNQDGTFTKILIPSKPSGDDSCSD